nr:hypothetical protein [Tanacetum cinerariifolium]
MADVNAPSDQTLTMAPPRKHRFHPRPDSPLHLSNEEPVLGYLKFSAKGTKREIFGMPIPGTLITSNIRAALYYQEYQENVAKHRGFLAGETRIPAKPQEHKRKQASRTTDKPAKAKRIKRSISRNTRQSRGSPKSVGASEAKEVPAEEPQVAEEDVDFLKAVEESMKDAYALPKGQLLPVVIREPESEKYQPLPEVPGKGKAKVSEEQVAHDLLSLQKHKKTNSEEESKKVVLRVEQGSQDEDQSGPDPNAQAEGQTGSDSGAQVEGQAVSNPDETSEGQAGSNPDETSEGQARPDPGNAEARVQSTSSPVVHAGSDREHMDTDVANVTLQPSMEQLYEGFTATIYPNVQENLKLAVKEPVLLEEPASSSGTLSSLQHLSRDFTFGDQFLCDKPSDADKSVETEVESMSPKELPQLKATTTDITTTTTTLPPLYAPQQSTTEAMMVKRIGELEHTLADLIKVNKTMEERDLPEADMKEILHQRMWETDSYKSHEVHMQLFEALEKSINRDQSEELGHDLAEARKKKKKSRESPKTPPGSPSNQPPPPSLPAGSAAPSPAKTVATTKYQAWSTPDVTLNPLVSLTPDDLDLDEAMGPDKQAQLSDEEDIENSLLAHTGDITKPQDLEGPAYEIVKVFHPDVIHLQYQMKECHKLLTDSVDDPILRHNVSKPLPLGGPPGQVTIQSDFFFNKDLEYLRYGSKGRHPALSISKMKAAYYPDAGPEQMVPDQFWIEEECKYDIAAMYGISHWWFQRQRFYIDRHTSEGHLNHLPPKDKKILTTTVNQWTRQLVIRQRVEDFQLGIESYQTQ